MWRPPGPSRRGAKRLSSLSLDHPCTPAMVNILLPCTVSCGLRFKWLSPIAPIANGHRLDNLHLEHLECSHYLINLTSRARGAKKRTQRAG